MVSPAPRSFLLTVHEPGSAVLEDLRTGQRVHVADLAEVGPRVAGWLDATRGDESPRPTPDLRGQFHA